MKLFFFLIIMIIFLSIIVNAQEIKVNIKETLNIEALNLNYNSSIENGEPLKVSFELFNSGSIAYKARTKLSIYNQNNLLQTMWGNEEDFVPGITHHVDIYYPVNQVGNFKAELKVYFANEIKEIKSFNFKVKKTMSPDKIFDIKDFTTYEKEIEFNVISNKTLDKILIVPTNCPMGWICEQTKIERMNENELNKIKLPYIPSLWKENDITINILTKDGKYITTEVFTLKRVGILRQFLHDLPMVLEDIFR